MCDAWQTDVSARCGGCGELAHDEWGYHTGVCRSGNRGGLWSVRSSALEQALVSVCLLQSVTARLTGGTNWFGTAGYVASTSGGRGSFVAFVSLRLGISLGMPLLAPETVLAPGDPCVSEAKT